MPTPFSSLSDEQQIAAIAQLEMILSLLRLPLPQPPQSKSAISAPVSVDATAATALPPLNAVQVVADVEAFLSGGAQ